MSKICSESGCTNPVFGGGKCKYHQFRRSMRGGDKYKAKSPRKTLSEARSPRKGTPMPKESLKRKEQAKAYKEVKDEIRAELIAEGKYNCFFCTEPMGAEKGFHHTKGRDGSRFIEKKWLVPGHNECHVDKYHHTEVAELVKLPWYSGFLQRLRALDEELYRKELKKFDKSGTLFEE
jgi:hypothetical protein